MGQFFIDDSVHTQAGFALGALVYSSDDVAGKVDTLLNDYGYIPDSHEFKSNTYFSKDPVAAVLRGSLLNLLNESCKIGVTVVPIHWRDQLGYECLKAARQFLLSNRIRPPTQLYFDEGLFPSRQKAEKIISDFGLSECQFFLEQNSKKIKGIQLADLTAHSASIQLKDTLGSVKKMIKTGDDSGYHPNTEISLGFEIWAKIRYLFFNKGARPYCDDPIENSTLDVEPFGLYVSELCNSEFAQKVRQAFSQVYLGCIH